MRKIFILVFSASVLFSCNNNKRIKKSKCVVIYCEEINNITKSVHDNINRKKWKVKTSCCGNIFITKEPYQIGDTVTVTSIEFL